VPSHSDDIGHRCDVPKKCPTSNRTVRYQLESKSDFVGIPTVPTAERHLDICGSPDQ
jgi:hypothetical protein